MESKLSLIINKQIADRAKAYAFGKQISFSKIVKDYLKSLTSEIRETDFEISPFVKSISTGVDIPSDLDYKKEYYSHQIEKFK